MESRCEWWKGEVKLFVIYTYVFVLLQEEFTKWLTSRAFIFSRDLRALISYVPYVSLFLRALHVFLFYVRYVSLFLMCLTYLHLLCKMWSNPEETAARRNRTSSLLFKILMYLILNKYYKNSHCGVFQKCWSEFLDPIPWEIPLNELCARRLKLCFFRDF